MLLILDKILPAMPINAGFSSDSLYSCNLSMSCSHILPMLIAWWYLVTNCTHKNEEICDRRKL